MDITLTVVGTLNLKNSYKCKNSQCRFKHAIYFKICSVQCLAITNSSINLFVISQVGRFNDHFEDIIGHFDQIKHACK